MQPTQIKSSCSVSRNLLCAITLGILTNPLQTVAAASPEQIVVEHSSESYGNVGSCVFTRLLSNTSEELADEGVWNNSLIEEHVVTDTLECVQRCCDVLYDICQIAVYTVEEDSTHCYLFKYDATVSKLKTQTNKVYVREEKTTSSMVNNRKKRYADTESVGNATVAHDDEDVGNIEKDESDEVGNGEDNNDESKPPNSSLEEGSEANENEANKKGEESENVDEGEEDNEEGTTTPDSEEDHQEVKNVTTDTDLNTDGKKEEGEKEEQQQDELKETKQAEGQEEEKSSETESESANEKTPETSEEQTPEEQTATEAPPQTTTATTPSPAVQTPSSAALESTTPTTFLPDTEGTPGIPSTSPRTTKSSLTPLKATPHPREETSAVDRISPTTPISTPTPHSTSELQESTNLSPSTPVSVDVGEESTPMSPGVPTAMPYSEGKTTSTVSLSPSSPSQNTPLIHSDEEKSSSIETQDINLSTLALTDLQESSSPEASDNDSPSSPGVVDIVTPNPISTSPPNLETSIDPSSVVQASPSLVSTEHFNDLTTTSDQLHPQVTSSASIIDNIVDLSHSVTSLPISATQSFEITSVKESSLESNDDIHPTSTFEGTSTSEVANDLSGSTTSSSIQDSSTTASDTSSYSSTVITTLPVSSSTNGSNDEVQSSDETEDSNTSGPTTDTESEDNPLTNDDEIAARNNTSLTDLFYGLTTTTSQPFTTILVGILTVGCVSVLLVVAILGKRVYDSYKKRHYSRLDYLINGMYS